MKILFLDIDGVLSLDHKTLNDICIKNLKKIVDQTGCAIVLSSDWRLYPHMLALISNTFTANQIPQIIGQTPDLWKNKFLGKGPVPRYKEIQMWLKTNDLWSKSIKYAIVDDDLSARMPHLKTNYFRTWYSKGLSDKVTDAIIVYLNE